MSAEACTLSIERAVKAIEDVLLVDEDWAWDGLSVVLGVRLPQKQRIALATSALASLSSQQLCDAFEIFRPVSNCPLSPFLSATAEAQIWVESAYEGEIEAYLLTCFRRLPVGRKLAFLGFASAEVEKTLPSKIQENWEG